MTKMLNLDDLAQEQRQLRWKGQVYQMKEMSVDDFIKITKMSESISKDATVAEQMDMAIQLISYSFPEIGVEQLKTLEMPQLNALVDFTMAANEDAEEGAEEGK